MNITLLTADRCLVYTYTLVSLTILFILLSDQKVFYTYQTYVLV